MARPPKNERIKEDVRVQPIEIARIEVLRGECHDPWRLLRDRIAELETENRELRRLLASTQEYVS